MIERTWRTRTLTPSQFPKLSSTFKNSSFSASCLPKSFLGSTTIILLTSAALTPTNLPRKFPSQLILYNFHALELKVLSIPLIQFLITNSSSCSMAKTRSTPIQQKRRSLGCQNSHLKTSLLMETMKLWPLVLKLLQRKLTILPTLCQQGIV